MSLSVVTAVEPLPDFRAGITFADGYTGKIDLRPVLRGPAFEALRDPELFWQMFVEYETIAWPNGADISPETLRIWCEQGGVTELPETLEVERETARVAESS